MFSILVVSIKKRYSNFLKRVFVSRKFELNLKLKLNFFRRIYALYVGFIMKTIKKVFSNVKTRTNSNFAVKVIERDKHSFLLSV